MEKIFIVLGVAALWLCFGAIAIHLHEKPLKQEIKYLKEQNRIIGGMYVRSKKQYDESIQSWHERNNTVSALVESVLRLKKQSDSLVNIIKHKAATSTAFTDSAINADEWKTYAVPMSQVSR